MILLSVVFRCNFAKVLTAAELLQEEKTACYLSAVGGRLGDLKILETSQQTAENEFHFTHSAAGETGRISCKKPTVWRLIWKVET